MVEKNGASTLELWSRALLAFLWSFSHTQIKWSSPDFLSGTKSHGLEDPGDFENCENPWPFGTYLDGLCLHEMTP